MKKEIAPKKAKKLSLAKETIRRLGSPELDKVAGGGPGGGVITTSPWCLPPTVEK